MGITNYHSKNRHNLGYDITPKTICGCIIYTLVTGTATSREHDVPELAWGNLFSDHFWYWGLEVGTGQSADRKVSQNL